MTQQTNSPELLHYQQGEQKGVGIPAGHHPVTNLGQLDNHPRNQDHIAKLLLALGAPEPAGDYLLRWTGVDLDDQNNLWVYYTDEPPETGGWQY